MPSTEEIVFTQPIKGSRNNVYHISQEKEKPALIIFLEKQVAYSIEISENPSIYDESIYLSSLVELEELMRYSFIASYNYSSIYLRDLLSKLLAYEDYIPNSLSDEGFLYYIKLLQLSLQLVLYTISFYSYKELIEYILALLDVKNRERDLDLFLSGDMDIMALIFSNPKTLNSEQSQKLNSIIDGSDLPFKNEFKDLIDRKGYSTSSEVMLLGLLLLGTKFSDSNSELSQNSNELNSALINLQKEPSDTNSESSSTYLMMKNNKDSLVTIEDKKAVVDESYKVNSIMTLMGQNSKVDKSDTDSLEVKKSLMLLNVRNEKDINSTVFIDNSYELEQEYYIVDEDMKSNIGNINQESVNIVSYSNSISSSKPLIGTTDDVSAQESIRNDLNDSNNSLGVVTSSLQLFQSQIARQTALNKVVKEQSSNNTSFSSNYSDIIKNRVASLNNASSNSSLTNQLGLDSLNNSSTALGSLLAVVGAVSLLSTIKDNPLNSLNSLLNVLINPLETVLLGINALACSLKALQCLIVGVGLGLVKLSEDLIGLISSEDKLQFLQDKNFLKLDLMLDQSTSKLFGLLFSSLESIFEDRIKEIRPTIALNLKEDGLVESEQTKTNVVIESYRAYINTKMAVIKTSDSLLSDIKSLLNARASDLKASFDNTYENIMSLTNVDSCEPINLDLPNLDFLLDLKNPFQFVLPDFSIPRIDSKIIKCR